MVYSGKPSTGCYLCRRRKVKCDEARPGCRNCEIYGKHCPGYRPAIVFQEKSNAYRKWNSFTERNTETKTDDVSADRLALIPKPRWLADAPLEDHALCYFFDQYTTQRRVDGLPGFLESIPLLYVLSRENEVAGRPASCLRWATEAAALTSFAHVSNEHGGHERLQQQQRLELKARESYAKALHGLKEALSTAAVEEVEDGTLAAILLLVIFEDITGERPQLTSSHTAGLELFAQLHEHRRLDGKYSKCLFIFAYTQLQIQTIGLGGRPRVNLPFLVDSFDTTDPLQHLMSITTKLSQFILDLPAALIHDEGSNFKPDDISVEHIVAYLSQAQSLDGELCNYCLNIPDVWLPRIVYSRTGESLITYSSIAAGSFWNLYRCSRIIVQSIIGSLTEVMQINLTACTTESSSNDSWVVPYLSPSSYSIILPQTDSTPADVIQNMIVDICRSMPFLLGDVDSGGNSLSGTCTMSTVGASSTASSSSTFTSVDQTGSSTPRLKAIEGYGLLWPFWHVLTSHHSTPKQQVLAREALQRLDHDLGIKLAMKMATGVDWGTSLYSP